MGRIVLITGGARSGKSFFAEKLAKENSRELYFVATGQPHDKEMRDRIRRHKKRRGKKWKLIEEPLYVSGALTKIPHGSVVLDCVTLWLYNLMVSGLKPAEIKKEVLTALKNAKKSKLNVIIVTNEVGCGIVPGNRLAREYRDMLGTLNQLIAQKADNVYWMCSGIPVCIKGRILPQRHPDVHRCALVAKKRRF